MFWRLPTPAVAWENRVMALSFLASARVQEGKRRREGFTFSSVIECPSGLSEGSSLPPCPLLLFFVSLTYRSPGSVPDPRSDGAFFGCACVSKAPVWELEWEGVGIGPSEKSQGWPLFIVVPHEGGGTLGIFVWWVLARYLRKLEEFRIQSCLTCIWQNLKDN